MLNSVIRQSLLRQARQNTHHVARRLASTAVPSGQGKPWSIVIGAGAASGAAGYWYANANANVNAPVAPLASTRSTAITTKVDAKTIQIAFNRLQQVLPPKHVTVDEETLQFHGFTTNSYHNEGAPNIVVYPQSTDDVVKIIKIANELKVPVIPVAGLTSLEGHFSAPYGGICISFGEHMDGIVAFHEEDMDIVVQPGVGWETLNAYLKPHGLFFPLDPGPGACIGGMVGTGCSGTNAVRYGTMREWVLNVTAVMPDGSVVKTRQRPRKSSAGYDLTKLFIGSEGTLGVVTEITLKLATVPKETSVAVCDFPTIRDAAAVVPDIMKAGIQVGAVELLDEVMMKAINMANPRLGYEEKVTLFVKFSGPNKSQVQNDIKLVSEIVNNHKGGKFKYAKTEVERDELWEGRKVALWSSALLKPGCSIWTTDVVVPVSRLPDLIEQTKQDIATSFLPCPMVGHVGDGNFHVFILFDRDNEKETIEAKRLNARLVDRAIQMEGSCTGEHAVGIGKKHYLNKELGVPTVELMRTIKNAVDPNGIMNPGKLLPDQEKL
ncbi:D-lactate ferricytochrome c oxidoreductase [Umbelopsis sp. WA50703]